MIIFLLFFYNVKSATSAYYFLFIVFLNIDIVKCKTFNFVSIFI